MALAETLDARVAPLAREGGWPGAIVVVRSEREETAWATGALRPGDAFRIASVTKAFTAVTVLLVAESGVLGLDDPVTDLLAPRAAALTERLTAGKPATLRRLLGHTAGVRDYFGDPRFLDGAAEARAQPWDPLDLLAVAAELGPPHFEPGEGFRYSDTGYVIAGLALEHATGRALAELYRAHVLDPLALGDTWMEGREPARGPRLSRHYDGERDLTALDMTFDWAGGGLVSTAGDLARFIGGALGGGLLSRDARDALTTWEPRTRFDPGSTARYDRYGLGVGAIDVGGLELVGATGVWGAFAFWSPAQRIAIAGTVNQARVDRRPLLAAIVAALRE